ncbi:hypothetical protein QQ045_014692 [Rhodiola kirilowii]
MEGLIPLVLKKMKRNKIRRTYECLSDSAHNKISYNYNIDDFYANPPSTTTTKVVLSGGRHRRHNSMPEDLVHYTKRVEESMSSPSPTGRKEFVRFRSRRMLSWACINVA